MAFNVYFKPVVNDPNIYTKASPWRCDKCNKEKVVLIRGKIDYDTLILCKDCLEELINKIDIVERELKDGN